MRIEYKPDSSNEEIKSEHVLSQGTTINDEIRNQSKKMKGRPFKEKFAYFFEYYKWPVIATVSIAVVLFMLVKAFVLHKDYGFYAMIVNSVNINSERAGKQFGEYVGLDLDKYDCFFDICNESLSGGDTADVSTTTKFAAMVTTSDLDVTVYNSELFYRKSLTDVYADLSKILSPEDIEKYSDLFYYVDGKTLKEIENGDDSAYLEKKQFGTYEERLAEVKTHMDPSQMEEPIPVGIIVDDAKFFTSLEAYYDTVPVLGITVNSQRTDLAIKFLHYIFDDSMDFSDLANPMFK